MDYDFDPQKSLLQLTDGALELPEADRHMEAFLARVAGKPVRRLSAGELLVLLRHHLALEFVAPLTLDKLEGNPWLQAERHPGDLLIALMESDSRFWRENEPVWLATAELLAEALATVTQATELAQREAEAREEEAPVQLVGDDFMAALLHFRGLHQD